MIGINLNFDYRDIFKAPRIAGGKNIWIFITGNLTGYVIYWIFTILSFMFVDCLYTNGKGFPKYST